MLYLHSVMSRVENISSGKVFSVNIDIVGYGLVGLSMGQVTYIGINSNHSTNDAACSDVVDIMSVVLCKHIGMLFVWGLGRNYAHLFW